MRQADAQGYGESGIGTADAKDLNLQPGQAFFNGPTLVQIAKLTADPSSAGAGSGMGPGSGDTVGGNSTSGDPTAASGRGMTGMANNTGRDEDWERLERERLMSLADSLAGEVDARLKTAPLPQNVGPLAGGGPLRPVIGLADLTCAPFTLDLTHNDVSVIGDPRSGRSNALATIGRRAVEAGAEVWVLGPPNSPLRELVEASRSCFADGEERQGFIDDLADLADLAVDRSGRGRQIDQRCDSKSPPLLLLDDYDLLPENDRALSGSLERLLGSVRFVASGSKPRGFSSSPIVQLIRASRSMIYLRPVDGREATEVVGVPVPWHPGLAMVEGRGLVVVDRIPTMVQLSNPTLG